VQTTEHKFASRDLPDMACQVRTYDLTPRLTIHSSYLLAQLSGARAS